MVWDALRARRHGKPSGRGERSHVGEPYRTLSARAARPWGGGLGRGAVQRARGPCGCRGKPDAIRAGPQRRLARLAVRTAARSRHRLRLGQLPSAHARDVRELRGRAARRTSALGSTDRALDRGGLCAAAGGTAADLSRRLRISRLCAARGTARPRPLHPRGRRSANRRDLPLRRVALPALAIRPTVHARLLCARAAGVGRGPVDAEGRRGRDEPWRDSAHRASRAQDGPLGQGRGGVRRAEPCAARAGGRRRPQRYARAARPSGRVGARRRGPTTSACGRRRARPRHRREGLGGACAAVRRARAVGMARAGARGRERRRRDRAACDRRDRRLRRARVRIPRRARRAAAADRDPQHSRRDRSARRP
jgi:hypothetical protein